MNLRRLGILSKLFDEIKGKVEDDTLSYEFARDGLQTVLAGRKILPAGQSRLSKTLLLSETSAIEACPTERLEIGQNKYGCDVFKGYEDVRLYLGPFFTEHDSPATEGGTCAIFQNTRRMSLVECAQELLDTEFTDQGELKQNLLEMGITFSIRQVVEMLQNDLVNVDRRGAIFFVHNDDKDPKDAVAVAFMSGIKNKLYGKSVEDGYAYAKGAQIVSRTIPPHLQPQ